MLLSNWIVHINSEQLELSENILNLSIYCGMKWDAAELFG
jgi:hypothetical protein